MENKAVTLDNLNLGAVKELFEEAWKRVLENISDENTKPTITRTLTISIKVKPSENRESAQTVVQVKESLAPLNPHEHFITLQMEGDKLNAYTSDPKQQNLVFDDNVLEFKKGVNQ